MYGMILEAYACFKESLICG